MMVQAEPDDELAAIVQQACTGDLDAFSTLFEAYNQRICTYLARIVGNDEEGRDLAQETFLRAWRMLPGMRDPIRFGSWLYRIATNMALDYLRKQKSHRWLPWLENPPAREQAGPLQAGDFPERISEAEHIKQALACVAPKYRACLLLQIEGGFSQREIATLLHLSEKSISIYVQRAGEQFRQAYDRLAPTTERKRSQ